MASSGIKPEIKIDPAEDKKNLADIEEFEDDNDLKFPNEAAQAWLLKLPAYLWKEWDGIYAKAPENERIRIGTLRVWNDAKDPHYRDPKLILDHKLPAQRKLPPVYDLDISSRTYNNTVVFSEKDIPGYRPRARNYKNHKPAPGALPTKQERYGEKLGYRSAIPKQTALAPKLVHEARVIPIEDDNYTKFMTGLWEEIQPTKDIEIEGMERNRQMGLHNMSAFSTSSKIKGNRKKPAKEKNVRMEKSALTDAILRCFKVYSYWKLSGLRMELRQPEAYIKEMLEEMAVLVKGGDFMNTWKLKPEWETLAKGSKEEVAKTESGTDFNTDDVSEDDDDEDGNGSEHDFEDVKMED